MSSPIDDLFESVFGYRPAKEGEAYEKFAAAACKLFGEYDAIYHNQRLRGLFSKELYQIDVVAGRENEKQFGEAKDYSDRKEKVGRGDLQKLGGALRDLPVSGGLFFSATDFTRPAKRYAAASEQIISKPIKLFHLRPVTERDSEGRIKSITFRVHILTPDYDAGHFKPIWTDDGFCKAQELHRAGSIAEGDPIDVDKLYKGDGEVLTTIRQLTSTNLGGGEARRAVACFVTPGAHLRVAGSLISIRGVQYDIPYTKESEELVIRASGRATLRLKSEDGSVDRILTDIDLKAVRFTEDGEVKL